MERSLPTFFTQVRIWKGKHSLEIFTLKQHNSGFTGHGMINADHFNVRYQINTDPFWRVLQVNIENTDRPWLKLELSRTETDLWYNAKGVLIPELIGCQEADISATPFTNTLALKKLSEGQQKRFKVVYIRIPEFSFLAVEQVYHYIGPGKYRYENLNTKFSAELSVDEYGLISEYPGLFKTLLSKPD